MTLKIRNFSFFNFEFYINCIRIEVLHDVKNSQFFTRKSAKSVGRVLSSRMQRANYVPARKGGRHLRDEQGMIYSLSKRREPIWTLIKQLQSEENTNIRKLMDET